MKGLINKGIQELVEFTFGTEGWERVKSIAGCDEPFFAISQDYPDEMTVALVGAVSEISGLSADTVMFEFGKFVVQKTLKDAYPTYFHLAGSSPREFLLNMDRVHEQATKSISMSSPPRFEYEELPDGRLLMRYRSERKLCPVLRGLIVGVGRNFNQDLQVRETTCMRKGDVECTMEVTFQ